jgi:hypothetical protein
VRRKGSHRVSVGRQRFGDADGNAIETSGPQRQFGQRQSSLGASCGGKTRSAWPCMASCRGRVPLKHLERTRIDGKCPALGRRSVRSPGHRHGRTVFLAGPDVKAGRFADTRARKLVWKEASPGALGRALLKDLLLMTAAGTARRRDEFPHWIGLAAEFLVLIWGNARLRRPSPGRR